MPSLGEHEMMEVLKRESQVNLKHFVFVFYFFIFIFIFLRFDVTTALSFIFAVAA